MKVAFVCVQNAGRSQMAHAFARREIFDRELDGAVRVVTGGTDPADVIHSNVVAAMGEVGIDLSERRPREIAPPDLADADVVVTMGCSAEGVCPATWRGDARDWDLPDPHGADPETTRRIRDEVRRRVVALLDELADGDPGP